MWIKKMISSIRNENYHAKMFEEKAREISDAKSDLETAFINFNEVTDSSYIDIAILKMNLAKRRFEVLLEEAKKDNVYLQGVN